MQPKRGLIIKKKFDSSHFLNGYQGNCANVHGHTYHLDLYLTFKQKPLNELNMLVDFKTVDEIIEVVVKRYDHQLINALPPYGHPNLGEKHESLKEMYQTDFNPTAEFMAETMFKEINLALQHGLEVSYNVLEKIVIWETDKYAASYELVP